MSFDKSHQFDYHKTVISEKQGSLSGFYISVRDLMGLNLKASSENLKLIPYFWHLME